MKNPAQSTRAFQLFLTELQDHIAAVEAACDESRCAEASFEAARRLHMVKGSAGFFGLSALADCAAKIEALLLSKAGGIVEIQEQAQKFRCEAEAVIVSSQE